jgi:hypothetical protein
MRSAIGYLVVALVLFLGGRVLFGAASLEQRTADAEQALLTLRYGDLDATYEALAAEAADRAPLPRVSQALVSSLRAQQSTTRYWLGSPSATPPGRWPNPIRCCWNWAPTPRIARRRTWRIKGWR